MSPALHGPDKVLFVGAGTSKAVNGPNLEELIRPVAELALRGYATGDRRSSSGRAWPST